MTIRNLYDSPLPLKALIDDSQRIILSEFENKDFVLINNGGTGANTASGARDSLQLIRFIDYSNPANGMMPLVPPEKNIICKSETGRMFYSANTGEWIPFGRISVSTEIGGSYNTIADVTNFIFTDGFRIELDGTSARVKLDIIQRLQDLPDVQLGPTDQITDGSALCWSTELQKFVPLFLDVDGKIARATADFAVNFTDLNDVDIADLQAETDLELLVYYDKTDYKLKFKKLIYDFNALTGVNLDTTGISSSYGDLVYDINTSMTVIKQFSANIPFQRRNGDMTKIDVNRTY